MRSCRAIAVSGRAPLPRTAGTAIPLLAVGLGRNSAAFSVIVPLTARYFARMRP